MASTRTTVARRLGSARRATADESRSMATSAAAFYPEQTTAQPGVSARVDDYGHSRNPDRWVLRSHSRNHCPRARLDRPIANQKNA